jgi:hypothetical protein
MPTVDFLPFATAGGANVVSQAAWAADPIVAAGYSSGIVPSTKFNKGLRQAMFGTAGLAKFISDQTGLDVLDDGDLTAFCNKLRQALMKSSSLAGNRFYGASLNQWSRGTSITVGAGVTAYTADGLVVSSTGGTTTVDRVTGIGQTVYSARLTGAAGVTGVVAKKRIESFDAAPLAGKRVTVQTLFKNNSGGVITPQLTVKHLNASDIGVLAPWGGAATTDVAAVNQTAVADGASAVLAYTFDANAASVNGMEVSWDFGAGLNGVGKNVTISDFDIRVTPGMTAGLCLTPPDPSTRPVTEDTLWCQRYLPAFGSGLTGAGQFSNSVTGSVAVAFQTPARLAPTGVTVNSLANVGISGGGQTQAPSTLTVASAFMGSTTLAFTIAGYGTAAAQGWGALLAGNSSVSVYFTGSEL